MSAERIADWIFYVIVTLSATGILLVVVGGVTAILGFMVFYVWRWAKKKMGIGLGTEPAFQDTTRVDREETRP